MIIAETSRLILRYFTYDDLDNLFPILSDSEVMRYSIGGVKTYSQTIDFLERIFDFYRQYKFTLYAVIAKETKQLIGFCGLLPWNFQDRKEIEVGYRLARKYWGKGLATEAATAIRDYAWQELKIDRLLCIIEPENTRSIRVAQKLGMIYERDTIFHGLKVAIYSVCSSGKFSR